MLQVFLYSLHQKKKKICVQIIIDLSLEDKSMLRFLILLRFWQQPRTQWCSLRYAEAQQWFSLYIQEAFSPKKLLTHCTVLIVFSHTVVGMYGQAN